MTLSMSTYRPNSDIPYSVHPFPEYLIPSPPSIKRLPTEAEIKGFFNGMCHALDICSDTTRGRHVAKAIRVELTSLRLANEQRKKANIKRRVRTIVEGAAAVVIMLMISTLFAFAASLAAEREADATLARNCRLYGAEMNAAALRTGSIPPCTPPQHGE